MGEACRCTVSTSCKKVDWMGVSIDEQSRLRDVVNLS